MNKSRRIITTISIILMILWTIYYYGFDYLKEYILLINEEIIEKEIIIDNTISEEEENEYEEVEINDENDEEEINELDHLSHIKYARNFLSLSGQKVYDALVKNSLVHNVSYFNITPISEKELIKVFTAFLNDNPDIFWVNNIKYYINANTKKVIKIEMLYSISKAERNLRQVQIDNVVNNIMEKVNEYHNDYDKIKYIHDYIIDNTTYDLNATDNQNIYSVFVNKKSVCTGYARSFQYLMNKLGIYSLYITGKIINSNEEGIGHAWNIVKIGNHYYHIDVTWGSSIFNTDQEEKEKYINYHYFNITTDELLKTHIIDMDYQLPLAKGITYNYYLINIIIQLLKD